MTKSIYRRLPTFIRCKDCGNRYNTVLHRNCPVCAIGSKYK